ncbi:MAG TPA: hypothetical protein VKT71_12295 [Candidatus Acidoferrales bacterium]|nr:hypothetical protein [Candidatus Acidoferrales bacterium]
MKRRIGILATVVLMLAAANVLLAQENPFVGSWTLNVAKSKFNPGPAPQSGTRTWDASGMVMVKGVNAAGKETSYGYTIKDDGKEYPTMGAIPNTADKISAKKVDANTYEAKFTKAGKQVETTSFKLSNGGKTLTIHAKGTSPAGPFDNLQVWEK